MKDCLSALTLSKGQLFLNSVTLYAYDDADVMNNDNYVTVLESFVKKVPGLDHLVLAKKCFFCPKKYLT